MPFYDRTKVIRGHSNEETERLQIVAKFGSSHGMLRCPAGASLNFGRSASREFVHESGPSTSPTRPTVSAVPCGRSVWHRGPKAIVPTGSVLSAVSCPRLPRFEYKPVMLGPMRWADVAGRSDRRTWMAHWRRQYVEILPLVQTHQEVLPPPRPPRAIRQTSALELAGPARPQCLVGTTATACHRRWCSRFSRHKRALGGTGKQKGFSMRYHNPLNGS